MVLLLLILLAAFFLVLWLFFHKFIRRNASSPSQATRETLGQSVIDAAVVAGGLATLFALGIAVFTYYKGDQLQRHLAASAVWREYLITAIEHPEFAEGKVPQGEPTRFARYEWFVGHALHAAEAVVEAEQDDEEWIATVCTTLIKHREYIKSKAFPQEHYSGTIGELVAKVRKGEACGL